MTNGVWRITASGSGICPVDQFHYVYRTLDSDGGLAALVENFSGGNAASQAGIMFRTGLEPSAPMAVVSITPGGTLGFYWRNAPGAGCISYSIGGITPPVWLKLSRNGNEYKAAYRTTTTTWAQLGSPQTFLTADSVQIGLMAASGSATNRLTATFSAVDLAAPLYGVFAEKWTGLNGTVASLAALTNTAHNPDWPASPAAFQFLSGLETPSTADESNYGWRLRTFVVPASNGSHEFWISSDDTSELLLSDTEWPEDAKTIASVPSAVGFREWTRHASQRSAPVTLQAGRRYYLEARMHQQSGSGHVSIRLALPDGSFVEPLTNNTAGVRLLPFTGVPELPAILEQPTDVIGKDGGPAVFKVVSATPAPVRYQWFEGTTPLPTDVATNSTLTLPAVAPDANGRIYTCRLTTHSGSVTSAPAILYVTADQTPPAVAFARYLNPTNIEIHFTEALQLAGAADPANYSFTNDARVLAALPNAEGSRVTLTTTPLTYGAWHVVNIRHLLDRATVPNEIPAGTVAAVFAAPFAPQTIGDATHAGNVLASGSGYDISGGGKDIGTAPDQFEFAYEVRTGDFDVRVRLEAFTQTDAFAKAGLMAREDLTPGSRYAASLASPSMAGMFFSSRVSPGSRAANVGNAPINYPNTWLRLKREGTMFTGFASHDGQSWQQLGTATFPVGSSLYFGMAVSSRNSNLLATAKFRDLSETSDPRTAPLSFTDEVPGPSSRKTGLAITELMHDPPARSDGRDLEFAEIFNSQPFSEDISGYRLGGDIAFTFPPGTTLAGGSTIVVAADPEFLQQLYGLSGVAGPFTNSLSNDSGIVQLFDRWGALLLDINYDTRPPWPVSTRNTRHSLILAKPSYGEASAQAWRASDRKGGSPGAVDGISPDPARGVVINEFLANSNEGRFDYVELFNTTSAAVDLSGCFLSDDARENKFQIPSGTVIGPRATLVFEEKSLNFKLNAEGESIFLVNRENTRVLDAVVFEAQSADVSSGRFPDGAQTVEALSSSSPGLPNTRPAAPDIVINEILYHPASDDDNDQFVELYNQGPATVDLSGWAFTDGIQFSFPKGASLPANAYAVVARDRARMLTNYPGINPALVFGNFEGSLSGRGERLALERPELFISPTPAGGLVTNTSLVLVDEVEYGTDGKWGQWSDGGGSSLELVDSRSDNRLAPNWADSDESQKAPWTLVERTGILEYGNWSYSPNQLHVIMMGAGECLVDNVEVFRVGETNRVINGTFDNGTASWVFQGTHRSSTVESDNGFGGGPCLHLRASARGDTGANRSRTTLRSGLSSGMTVTLRARVRWLKGNREMLLRLYGNWLEAAGRLEIPRNPGTPGAPNSRRLQNAGPAITQVSHTPVLPGPMEPVTVTAQLHDPDGISAARLIYRNDTSSTAPMMVPMTDDGLNGDYAAGDGVFTATLPGQGSRSIAAFSVEADDATGQPATSRFPSNTGTECLVSFGEPTPAGALGSYHLLLTKATISHWASREKNSNDPLDATFVYGNSRVVYNMKTLYSGSPFHTGSYTSPMGTICDYVLNFPDDDLMLGANDFVISSTGNLGNDETAQREQAAFWILRELGAPTLNRRYIQMFVNGQKRGAIMEDSQQPNSDVIEQYFPGDADGQLFKIEDWFEFDSGASGFSQIDATLDNFTIDGIKRTERYRWNWRPRAVKGSSHDFTNLFLLADAVQLPMPEPYNGVVSRMVDVEEWMRTLALERMVGNWDSFAYNRGKNMYAYKPQRGPWVLIPWDIDFVMDRGDGPTSGLFWGQDPAVNMMWQHAPFARAYWRAFYDAVNGPLQDSRIVPYLQEKYAALVANGIAVSPPTSITTYISRRRSSLQSQLNEVNAPFNVSTPVVSGNTAILSGTAPVSVQTIRVNDMKVPVTWTGITSWRAVVPLENGVNRIAVAGFNSSAAPVAGASRIVSVTYNGPGEPPPNTIVFSEIMHSPAAVGAEFVELYNTSQSLAVDLSGWRVNGLGYTFPQGTLLLPGQPLVLAANAEAFTRAYGILAPFYDTFPGQLQPDGETLSLMAPLLGAHEIPVTRVRYEGDPPWPNLALIPGASLQLIDPRQDNWRAGNWGVADPNAPVRPQWVQVTAIGVASASRLYLYLESPGDIYLDDIKMVAGTIPEAGNNLVRNAGFESPLAGSWTATANFSKSQLSTALKRTGNSSLHLVAGAAGSGSGNSIYQDLQLTVGAPYSLSFWFLQSTNGGPLVVRLSGFGVSSGPISPAPSKDANSIVTPGAPSSIARPLLPFPTLWINEVQPENTSGIVTGSGQRSPWIELYNGGPNPVWTTNLFLSARYQELGAWAFPSNTVIAPGEFKLIFADARADLSSTNELHANFQLTRDSGQLALTRILPDEPPQVLDYLEYSGVPSAQSFGSVPDGQSFERRVLYYSTPGVSNNPASAPITVRINEWMAANTTTLMDPMDNHYDDWFELYNPGSTPADLSGFYLTDDLTDKFLFKIPGNGHYTIAPQGFLLVWADGEPDQNSTNHPHLHTSFRLSAGGEAIGLFAPDGTPIDAVAFGEQSDDVSQGRSPDGGDTIAALETASPSTNNVARVIPPSPVFSSVAIANGELVVTWESISGLTYQIEVTSDLLNSAWTSKGSAVDGTGQALSVAIPLESNEPQKFYRLSSAPVSSGLR